MAGVDLTLGADTTSASRCLMLFLYACLCNVSDVISLVILIRFGQRDGSRH